jgi:NADH dehydrogenase (ubiquinone) Fe-S protein 6
MALYLLYLSFFHYPAPSRTVQSRHAHSGNTAIFPTDAPVTNSKTMNVFGRRILSAPRVLARFTSSTAVVPPHPPASTTPTFETETAVSNYPQAPNHPGLWSENQRPRPTPATGPRFEQTAMQLQPQPLSAMEMIAKESIRLSKTRIAACDGGAG